jgi:hypothetical protein
MSERERKITDYFVAWNADIDGLRSTVLKLISEGWEPQGGITYLEDEVGNGFKGFAQAMIKRG